MSKLTNFFANIFHGKNKKSSGATVMRVNAIDHATDAVGWRPVSYTIPARYDIFLTNLESEINAFISSANPDRYNPRYYMKTIDEEVSEALKEIAEQRTDHDHSVHNIRDYQLASLHNIELKLEELEKELKRLEDAYNE